MDNVYEISLLMDFYGQLITKRQYEILDLHYSNDYSLGEIAELLDISRQGVYDNVKKGRTLLIEFEKKLGLVKKFLRQKVKTEKALNKIRSMNTVNLDEDDRQKLKEIEKIIDDFADTDSEI